MRRTIAALSVLTLVSAGCGSSNVGDAGPLASQPPTTTTTVPPDVTTTTTEAPVETPADQVFVELYFVKEGTSAKSVVRAVDTPNVATNAIEALIDGPTPDEQDGELSTAIPSDTLLLGLTIDDGLATIDLSREFEVGGGSFNILSRLAQVVYTLTQFPTVDEVLFHLDGEPVEVFSGEGVVLEDPVGRGDYTSLLPIEPLVDPKAEQPWDQDDLPDLEGVPQENLRRVVLVPENDVLNVRQDPGVGAPIVGMLLPGVVVERNGQEAIVGSSVWAQVETPFGGYWVNDRFLGANVSAADFADDERVVDLLDEFALLIETDGDIRDVMSKRGLYVWFHADPVRWTPGELQTILTDTTTYQWPSNALSSDDPEFLQVPARTFADAVADSFLSAFDDPDTVITINEPIEAGNGRTAAYAIPHEFASFNYVGVYDPADNPDYGGLDWSTWYVSIDYENAEPVIVGLTIDEWAP